MTTAPDPSRLQVVQLVRKGVLLMAIVAAGALAAVSRTHTGIHESLEEVGLILVGVCIVGRSWCSLYIGGRKTEEIVNQGPYSISRNPLYVFSVVGAFGVGLQTGSITLALVFLVITLAVFYATALREEAWLTSKFGSAYQAYLKTTPRFWPKLRLWRDVEILEVRPSLFLITLRDGLAFLAAVPIFEAMERAQQVGLISTLFALP